MSAGSLAKVTPATVVELEYPRAVVSVGAHGQLSDRGRDGAERFSHHLEDVAQCLTHRRLLLC